MQQIEIQENIPRAPLTTFGVGGSARWFARVESETEMLQALDWARTRGVSAVALGGGSNLLVPDRGFPGLIVALALRGIVQEGNMFRVAAGENWDRLVSLAVADGLAGMECLAGIPGSVGATPVQNVGAYGQEVADTVRLVRAYDRVKRDFVELQAPECRFRYRESLFNTDERGRFLITRVDFELRPAEGVELHYADLRNSFAGRPGKPSVGEVAEAVRAIRRSKGMVLIPGDPDTQSAGSYFKNPIVPCAELAAIAKRSSFEAAAIPTYAAAWLVESAGFPKGFQLGRAGVSTRHTLALTNRGGATCAEILQLEEHIRSGVLARFGVRLEREPILLEAPTT